MFFRKVPVGESRLQRSDDVCRLVLLSCSWTLIRLGDLSRWREMQLVTTHRKVGPAIAYYELAGRIHPTSGASHNQRAIVALQHADHLRVTYHMYRALAVEVPHPLARVNLGVELKKIDQAWTDGQFFKSDAMQGFSESQMPLIWCHLRLHARCYKGSEFPGYQKLEDEMLGQLVVQLKGQMPDDTLNMLILINLAADYHAHDRNQREPSSYRNFYFSLG